MVKSARATSYNLSTSAVETGTASARAKEVAIHKASIARGAAAVMATRSVRGFSQASCICAARRPEAPSMLRGKPVPSKHRLRQAVILTVLLTHEMSQPIRYQGRLREMPNSLIKALAMACLRPPWHSTRLVCVGA